eukprot:CAMPEP_0118799404 /NCGR_PEP_ID=MMETSP1161-20130426/1618_1 /TAXON_ID=249345 /ORGANISM="Picochlorum oklahomensis, Strain CCMP2329" /LENGTH=246 /DNA_ID=CAMNT_0006727095 /DNA_START=1240 /DNA_END=1980 /DNA_ORIENTATION=-
MRSSQKRDRPETPPDPQSTPQALIGSGSASNTAAGSAMVSLGDGYYQVMPSLDSFSSVEAFVVTQVKVMRNRYQLADDEIIQQFCMRLDLKPVDMYQQMSLDDFTASLTRLFPPVAAALPQFCFWNLPVLPNTADMERVLSSVDDMHALANNPAFLTWFHANGHAFIALAMAKSLPDPLRKLIDVESITSTQDLRTQLQKLKDSYEPPQATCNSDSEHSDQLQEYQTQNMHAEAWPHGPSFNYDGE